MANEDPELERRRRAALGLEPKEGDAEQAEAPSAGTDDPREFVPPTSVPPPVPPASNPPLMPPEAPGGPPKLAHPTSPALSIGDAAGKEQQFVRRILAQPGKPIVDKYFGSRLPPVCRQLGCYVTDDGKFFYCINPHCHKDRKRETKYNRRRKSLVYFFCPKCKSREIQLHLKNSHYECLECAYTWRN